MVGVLLLLLALQCERLGALAMELPSSTLQLSEIYFRSSTVTAPTVVLEGVVVRQVASTDLPACSAACRDDDACSWFNFCSTQGGCMVDGRQLGYQQCLLQGANCTLVPAVLARNVSATSGFSIRTPGLEVPGYATRLAQGMQGGDLAECAGTVLPGACAFRSPLDAAAICNYVTECRAVMVYSNGTDGCSAESLAVLKRSGLSPSNEFMALCMCWRQHRMDQRRLCTWGLGRRVWWRPPPALRAQQAKRAQQAQWTQQRMLPAPPSGWDASWLTMPSCREPCCACWVTWQQRKHAAAPAVPPPPSAMCGTGASLGPPAASRTESWRRHWRAGNVSMLEASTGAGRVCCVCVP